MHEEPVSVTVFLSSPHWLKRLEMKRDPQSETSNSRQLLGSQVTSRSADGHGLARACPCTRGGDGRSVCLDSFNLTSSVREDFSLCGHVRQVSSKVEVGGGGGGGWRRPGRGADTPSRARRSGLEQEVSTRASVFSLACGMAR